MRTSGTTGDSKPIELAHEGVQDGIDTVLASLRSRSKPDSGRRPAPMPNLIPTGLALWSGLWNALFALRAGAPVVLLDRFAPADFARLVQQHGIRSTVLAPAMMSALVDDIEVKDLAPLTMVRSITAPLTPHQAQAFTAKFGVGVTNCYGQTELGSEVVGWSPSDLRQFGEAKLGAVGRAHHDVEINIRDDSHDELPIGGTGEIWIRSPFLSPSSEVASRVIDGFLRTGDLGRLDEDGFLWLEGRVSDVINRGGLKVLPQEVEEALRELPGVADACVAGVPDLRLGEVPMAWVVPATGQPLDSTTIVKSLRDRLAGYKMPVRVTVVADFPRNEVGKVLRRELVATWIATDAQKPVSEH
jgi:acyl-CoA synthetase (AMP-forming)/AMP-acid ligase II